MPQCKAEWESRGGTIWYCIIERDDWHANHRDDEGRTWPNVPDKHAEVVGQENE